MFHDGLFGEIYAVELVALVVDVRFGRVDVLHLDALGGAGQHAAAEGHYLAAERMDGKDDTSPETVAQAVVVGLVAEAGLDQVFLLVTLGQGFLGQSVVALSTIS